MQTRTSSLNELSYLLKEGPVREDYAVINDFFNTEYAKAPRYFLETFQHLRKGIAAFSSADSIAGFCFLQPYGYAGDFQLIDRLYTNYRGSGNCIERWDDFAQSQPAAHAVRNRKSYFIDLLERRNPANVLNIASGPCRDVKEYYAKHPKSTTFIDCVELDGRAIHYAQNLLHSDPRVSFIQQNILKYKPLGKYGLVWSAGLFDYFSDSAFVRILKKLLTCVEVGGELVIGNFAADNPNKAFMEVGMNWFLHHRSPEQLFALAREAGAGNWAAWVEREQEGVNLFLHLKN